MTAIDPPYRFNSRPANNRNRRILLAPAEVGYLNGHRPFNLGGVNGSKCPFCVIAQGEAERFEQRESSHSLLGCSSLFDGLVGESEQLRRHR